MRVELVAERLETVAVLPNMRAALVTMVAQDWAAAERDQPRPHAPIATIYELLGGTDVSGIEIFVAAWAALRAALVRLDHLQDGDPEEPPLPNVTCVGAQYNIVFAYYVLATALLDDLDERLIPASRLLRLRRLWADCMLRAASGQQRDLVEADVAERQGLEALDHYQQAAQSKSGAVFALAFAGAAILATDDEATIAACYFAGEVYGTLIQFCDDLSDAATQSNSALTLPQAYITALTIYTTHIPQHTLHPYWQHIYVAYLNQLEQELAVTPIQVQVGIRRLFTMAFEQAPERSSDS